MTQIKKNFDYAGIFLSVVCGVHCVITPLLILSAPALGKSLESIGVHGALIFLMIFAFYQSIFKHYKIHGSKAALGLGYSGLILLITTYLNEMFSHGDEHHEVLGHEDENILIFLALLGGALLIVSHILDIRKCQCINQNGACK